MKLNEAVKRVARGQHPEEVLEKAIVSTNYDERLAVNSPTTVQRGNVTVNPEGFQEDHGECFDDPSDYGVYPMAGARMWPRGSHESNAQRGEPPYFKSEQLVARVVAGATPGQVLEGLMRYTGKDGIEWGASDLDFDIEWVLAKDGTLSCDIEGVSKPGDKHLTMPGTFDQDKAKAVVQQAYGYVRAARDGATAATHLRSRGWR